MPTVIRTLLLIALFLFSFSNVMVGGIDTILTALGIGLSAFGLGMSVNWDLGRDSDSDILPE